MPMTSKLKDVQPSIVSPCRKRTRIYIATSISRPTSHRPAWEAKRSGLVEKPVMASKARLSILVKG